MENSDNTAQLGLGLIMADFVSACLDSMAEQHGGLSSAAIARARRKHVAMWTAAARANLPQAADDDDDDLVRADDDHEAIHAPGGGCGGDGDSDAAGDDGMDELELELEHVLLGDSGLLASK